MCGSPEPSGDFELKTSSRSSSYSSLNESIPQVKVALIHRNVLVHFRIGSECDNDVLAEEISVALEANIKTFHDDNARQLKCRLMLPVHVDSCVAVSCASTGDSVVMIHVAVCHYKHECSVDDGGAVPLNLFWNTCQHRLKTKWKQFFPINEHFS